MNYLKLLMMIMRGYKMENIFVCPKCNKPDLQFVFDKYEDGVEIPRLYCAYCDTTFKIKLDGEL